MRQPNYKILVLRLYLSLICREYIQLLYNYWFNLKYNVNEMKVTKSSCYITFTLFLLCLNSFSFFLFHFILKRYVFIFACAVVIWLEQDGVHKIVHPIHTRFLNKKCNFCWNIFHIKHIRNVMILQHRMKSWSAECFNIM